MNPHSVDTEFVLSLLQPGATLQTAHLARLLGAGDSERVDTLFRFLNAFLGITHYVQLKALDPDDIRQAFFRGSNHTWRMGTLGDALWVQDILQSATPQNSTREPAVDNAESKSSSFSQQLELNEAESAAVLEQVDQWMDDLLWNDVRSLSFKYEGNSQSAEQDALAHSPRAIIDELFKQQMRSLTRKGAHKEKSIDPIVQIRQALNKVAPPIQVFTHPEGGKIWTQAREMVDELLQHEAFSAQKESESSTNVVRQNNESQTSVAHPSMKVQTDEEPIDAAACAEAKATEDDWVLEG